LHYSLTPEIKKNSNSRPITPKTTINSEINTISNKFLQTIKNIDTFKDQIVDSKNIIENNIDILKSSPEYSIVQCISADFKHDTQLSNKITQKYGNMSFILENLELILGKITTINIDHRTIHYLITKDKYDSPISYLDLYENLYNLKNASIKDGYEYIAISKTNITNEQLEWGSI
jgi:hypothetical protein